MKSTLLTFHTLKMSIITPAAWFQAASTGSLEIIAENLHQLAGSIDIDGSTALIKAAENGHSDLVQILLELEARHINTHGETALLAAASKNHAKCCELLVPVEYDILSPNGLTALHVAAHNGSSAVLHILHQYIRDCYDKNGYTVLDHAAMAGGLESVIVLRKLLSPNRKMVSKAMECCHNKETLDFLQSLYDDASQRYYGSMDDLSTEVDKLLSAVPSFTEHRLSTITSSFNSDLGAISVQRYSNDSLSSMVSSRTKNDTNHAHLTRPASYRKESPKVHGTPIRYSSFSYSQAKSHLNFLEQQILHQASQDSHQVGKRHPPHHSGKSRRTADSETQTNILIDICERSIQLDDQLDSTLELFKKENLRLVEVLSNYESMINEKNTIIAQLQQSIELYKQQIIQLKATSQQTNNITDNTHEYNMSILTGSVVNSRQQYVQHTDDHSLYQSTLQILDTTQTSLTSTRRRHRSSKTTEALESQIKELVERLKTSHEQLKRASQREQQYENIKQRLIALSNHINLSTYIVKEEVETDNTIDSNYLDEDKDWNEGISNALLTISYLCKAFKASSHTLMEQKMELERLHDIEAKLMEQAVSNQNVDALHSTIKDLHRQLEERSLDLDKLAELQVVKAELSSLQCKHDILLRKTATLEQNNVKRGYNESIYAEKLGILRDIQERGYLADPAYRVLLSRCEDLEVKLLETRKQNEKLTNEILDSKIKLSKLENTSYVLEDIISTSEEPTTSNTRPPSSRRVRIQSVTTTPFEHPQASNTSQSTTAATTAKEESQEPIPSLQSNGNNFFDQHSLTQTLPTVPTQEIFKDSLHFTDMLTTTMLNTTRTNTSTSMLQSNLYDKIEPDGTTPLMHAAVENDIEKADKHMRYAGMAKSDGTTALMVAAEHNSINVAELLIKDEACMFREDGMRALDIAEACGNTAVAALLRTVERPVANSTTIINASGRVFTELMSAAENRNVDTALVLSKHQSKCRDAHGKTALMCAAAAGCTEIVSLLLDQEGGMQDDAGRTALMYACMHGHPECVELLYSKEISIQDNKGNKPLRYAVDKASHGDRNIENKILEILCIPH